MATNRQAAWAYLAWEPRKLAATSDNIFIVDAASILFLQSEEREASVDRE